MNIKRLYTLIISLFLIYTSTCVFAQQLPDAGFENWSGTAFNGSAQMVNWNGSNVKQTYMGITAYGTMCTQATSPHGGTYCAKLSNTKVEAAGIGEVAPAWLTLGTPFADITNGISGATAGTYGGLNFTYRPDTLVVWVKHAGNDRASEDYNIVYYSWSGTSVGSMYNSKSNGCVTINTKTDEESDIRQATDGNACGTTTLANQISEGFLRSRTSYSNWTELRVPITYWSNDVPQKMNIILSAGNYPNFRATTGIYAGNTMYVDDIRLIYSSKIGELYINNKKWNGFDPNATDQTYALGVGVTTIPTISARRSGRTLSGSEITITNGTVGGAPTVITVRAEDNSSTTTYNINFVAEQSTNPRPAAITVNGTAISGFSGYQTSYNVALPYGTTAIPTIDVVKAEDGQTYTITPCTSLPGAATVTVYAENTSYSATYTINMSVAQLSDNTLQDILVGGESLAGFSPTKNSYTVELPLGTTAVPTITPVSAYAAGAQTIVSTNNGLDGIYNIAVSAPGNATVRNYKLTFRITASTYSYLRDLQVGGATLTGFDPELLNYSYSLPIGTVALPAITWVAGDSYQTIVKEEGGIDGVTKITVTAASGAVSIYRITFSTLKSSVATLGNLQVGGTTIAGFSPDVFSYTYELPIGTTALPSVTYVAGDSYQTITMTTGGINGTTRIIVQAQDGTVNTYSIVFSVAQASVTTLLDLQIDGVTIEGFSPNVYEYNYVLPHGATTMPTITWTAHDSYQTIRKVEAGVNGDTKITVKSQTGDVATYTIHFSVAISSNAYLQNILIDGVELSGFESTQFAYTHTLPIGTTTAPAITYVAGDEYQTITITNGGLTGTTQIMVRSEDGNNVNTYTLNFIIAQAGVSTLLDLQVGGVTLTGFSPDNLTYAYVLPRGTTTLPEITYTPNDEFQTIRLITDGVNGATKIIVRAQTGATSTYTINFSVEKSTNSLLNNILVGGSQLPEFSSNIFVYNDTLPSGTVTLPDITWEKGDAYQTVYLTKGGVNGQTTLRVVAESGAETIYTINFSVEKSENAFLKNIFVDNVPLSGFDKTIFAYTYELPTTATACPDISVELDNGQSVIITKPLLTGNAYILVTPEVGNGNTYSINFVFPQSSNSLLADLQIGGTSIAAFAPETKDYTCNLPSGTLTLPEITYTKGDSLQTVYVTRGDVNSTTTLCVVAENGSESVYSITFNVLRSENALLQNILIDGVALTGFADSVFNYTYVLPNTATACPQIEAVKAEQTQQVYISTPNITGDAHIVVTPEVGLENTYTITFYFARSANSYLTDIKIGGTSIADFKSDSLAYTYELPNGTVALPAITWTKAEDVQNVSMLQNGTNGTTSIIVEAEDGSVSTYGIAFSVAKSSDATLQSIKLDGVEIAGFRSDSLNYTDTLAFDDVIAPTLTVEANHSAQNIVINAPLRNGVATINVTAENGATAVYTVTFVLQQQSNTQLKEILVDNVPLAFFNPLTADYTLDLPDGASVPNISYVAADSTQIITVANVGLNGTTILVTAENGDTRTYSVHYNLLPSNVCLLSDLQLYNGSQFVSIANFAPDVFSYTDTLAWRTQTVPVIYPVPAHQDEVITITYGAINDTTRIHVVSEDGLAMADYTIAFPVRKSAVTALTDLVVDGAELSPLFDSEILDYTVELPYGTTQVPAITWQPGEDNGQSLTEQQFLLAEAGLHDTTRLTVIAENGLQRTYNISFTVTPSSLPNELVGILVEGVGFFTESASDVNLPYGTTVLPQITCTKNYPEQTILIDNGGVYTPTTITVKANKEGVADKVYTLTPKVAALPDAVLSNILVNGTSIAGFEAGKFNYVVSVAGTQPTITYTAATGLTVAKTIENTKQTQITVEDNAGYTNVYNVFVHYTADVIPNSDFTNWTTATYNNAAKPVSWTVPADVAKSYSYSIFGTYTTGQEVTNDNNTVHLNSHDAHYSICGTIPGMMTLGSMTINLTSGGGSTSSVSGGISFRNTPDEARMDYKYTTKESKINNMRFLYTLSDGTNTFSKVFEDATTSSSWKQMSLPLLGNNVLAPTTMNITVNSTHSENADDLDCSLTSYTNHATDLYVDNIQFVYSSAISAISVNGTPATLSDNVATVTIDTEHFGEPTIEITGAVPDQEYDINTTEDESVLGTYKIRNVSIVSKAEDGTFTNYSVVVYRTPSANTQPACIFINGDTINGFAADTYTYTATISNGSSLTPDISVVRSSMHQSVSYITDTEKKVIVRVTAENGDVQDYTINLVNAESDETTLQNITLENNPADFTFAPETKNYIVTLSANEVVPTTSYLKQSDGQKVILTTAADSTTLCVIAENGTDSATYTIQFARTAVITSGQLTDIVVDEIPLSGFASDVYAYTTATVPPVPTYFERDAATDSVTQVITPDSIMWHVAGNTAHDYKLLFSPTLSNNTYLAAILVNGTALADFNSTIYDYTLFATDSTHVEAVCSEAGQTLTSTYVPNATATDTIGIFNFTVTAADASTTKLTQVIIRKEKSTDAGLAEIAINGERISTSSAYYTADKNFNTDSLNYIITLPCVNPKVAEPQLPNITAKSGAKGQTITIEKNSINASSYIIVTAEDGLNQNYYDLRFNSDKSGNADLTAITVNQLPLAGFAANVQDYNYQLTTANVPVVGYCNEDKFQTVIVSANIDSAVLKVTAENGLQKLYVIHFLSPILSTNAQIDSILINNVSLSDFASDVYDYTVNLPIGTTVLPSVEVKKADGTQTVEIQSNGVNGNTIITVTAEDGSQQVYTIHFNVLKSSNAQLAGISVNYKPVWNFAADNFVYTDTIANRIDVPQISYTAGDLYQQVQVTASADSAVLVVTAQDSIAQNTYVVHFVVNSSNNAYLGNILLDNVQLTGFSATTFGYQVMLPSGTTTMPEVQIISGAEGQNISVVNKGLRDTTSISVIAEDGITANTYQIIFGVEKSTIDTLKMIYLDGDSLAAFCADTLQYQITLPVGTRRIPFVSYTEGDNMQTITIDTLSMTTYAATVNIKVMAENNSIRTYQLQFNIEKSAVGTLRDITINGETIALVGNGFTADAAFDGNTFEYHVAWAIGTRNLPELDWIAGDTLQTVELTKAAQTLNDSTIITVTAENGNINTYTICYELLQSSVDTLQMIYLDGNALAGFHADTLQYQIVFPAGTRRMPAISYVPGDNWQTVKIDTVSVAKYASEFHIEVTAEDSTSRTYRLMFSVEKSALTTLSDLLLNGETILAAGDNYTANADFSANTFEYHITWNVGTRTLPLVEWLAGDTLQTVSMTKAAETLNDSACIRVVAENGDSALYTIYNTLLLSEVDTLQQILINGLPLEGFNAYVQTYDYNLPHGTTTLPNITWEAGDVYQTVDTVSDGVNGAFIFTVTAENGAQRIYTINFSVIKSDNALLENILANDTAIVGFDSEVFTYTLSLPYGTEQIPVITYTKAEDVQTVALVPAASLSDTTYITVTAENGTTSNVYKISFDIRLCDNALLNNIYIGGEPISKDAVGFISTEDFESETFEYSIGLPYGTVALPEITWEAQLPDSVYKSIVLENNGIDGVNIIRVISQDELNTNEYNLTFYVAKSNNTKLADLQVHNVTVEGFHPDSLIYKLVYPVGTDSAELATAADITYIEGDSAQTVIVSQDEPTVILITVMAENGDVAVYVIEQEILKSSNSLLKDIIIGGVSLRDFAPDSIEYNYLLLNGMSIPEVEAVKSEESQEVSITMGMIDELTYIYCTAQDGSETVYTILFEYSDMNPGDQPTAEDVCWSRVGDKAFKASTTRNNVKVALYDTSGKMIEMRSIPVTDPNDQICEPGAAGAVFNFNDTGKVMLYVFFYNEKRIVSRGKFLY